MVHRGAGPLAVILENHDVAQAEVLLQIQHAIPPGPEHLLDGLLRHCCDRGVMSRCLNDHFVRADAVHPVEQAFAFPVQCALNAQHRKLVRHHAHFPTAGVRLTAIAVREHLGSRLVLVPFAKWTESVRLDGDRFELKVVQPLLPLRGDDHPAACDGIFAEVTH